MDLLYSKYSNPLEFMKMYIEQNRFGEFVNEILEIEFRKRKKEMQKEEDDKLFNFYLHRIFDKSLKDFYSECNSNDTKDKTMDQEEISDIVNESYSILEDFEPS